MALYIKKRFHLGTSIPVSTTISCTVCVCVCVCVCDLTTGPKASVKIHHPLPHHTFYVPSPQRALQGVKAASLVKWPRLFSASPFQAMVVQKPILQSSLGTANPKRDPRGSLGFQRQPFLPPTVGQQPGASCSSGPATPASIVAPFLVCSPTDMRNLK